MMSHSLRVLSVLAGAVITTVYSQKCTAVGCNNDGSASTSNSNSIVGYPTLKDLQCGMQQELDLVNAGTPLRDAPYSYILCPNTTYEGEDPIIPLLNDTIILCGEETAAAAAATTTEEEEVEAKRGSCRISVPVHLVNNLPYVQFRDLTFDGGDFPISVLAVASANSVALFQACHWTNRTGAIHNVPNGTTTAATANTAATSTSTIGPSVMQVHLNSCTMMDSDTIATTTTTASTFGIRSYGGTIVITNLTVSNYNVSTFLDIRDRASVSIQNALIEGSTLKDAKNFEDFMFVHNESKLILDAVHVTTNAFSNFCWIQANAVVEVNECSFYDNRNGFGAIFRLTGTAAGLTIRNSDLSGLGFSLISVSGNGPALVVEQSTFVTDLGSNHAIWSFTDLSLAASCFTGSTKYPPIFVSESEVDFVDVFSDVNVLESNCTGLFVEEMGDECFYPDRINPEAVCQGQCIELDSDSCSTTRYPPAPTCDLDDCPILPNIGSCAKTLKDLRCIMCGEAKAIAGGATLRLPPYVYSLCPNTFFPIANEREDVIFPILNGTRIFCGADGFADNNCTVDSGVLQVEIGQQSRDPNDTFVSPLPLEHVEISGITFTNGVNAQFGVSPSVWARAPPTVVAILRDCSWSEGVGSNILMNMNLDESEEIIPSMHVRFDDCSFESIVAPETHIGILSVSGSVTMTNAVVKDSDVGISFGRFLNSQVSISDTVFVNCTALQDAIIVSGDGSIVNMTRIEVRDNSYTAVRMAGFLTASSIVNVDDAIFSGNDGVVDVLASGLSTDHFPTSVSLERCTFEFSNVVNRVMARRATLNVTSSVFFEIKADTGVQAVDSSILELTDVCFIGGEYVSPVRIDSSTVSFENVFGDENVEASSDCTGVSIVSNDGQASCDQFDATRCALSSATPTEVPSSSPTTTRSPSSPMPTSSALPSLNVVWGVVLSLLMLLALS